MRSDLIKIECTIKHETAMAYLVDTPLIDEPVWIPKSMCEYDKDAGEIEMRESYAVEKELI